MTRQFLSPLSTLAICCAVAIVGCHGRHLADDSGDGHIENRDVGHVDRVREDSETDTSGTVEQRGAPVLEEHSLLVGGRLFRRDGAFEASLGKFCDMATFYDCDWKGYIGGKAKIQALGMATYPAFTITSDQEDSGSFQAMLPNMFHTRSKSTGSNQLRVQGSLSNIEDELEIMEMINSNPTQLKYLQSLSEPHIVTGIITIEQFEDESKFTRTGSGGVSARALEKGAKVAAAAATGNIPGGIIGLAGLGEFKTGQDASSDPYDGDPPSERQTKSLNTEDEEDLLGGESPRLSRPMVPPESSGLVQATLPGDDDGIAGENSVKRAASVKFGAGTVVGYDVKRIEFTNNWISQNHVARLVSDPPTCELADGIGCWARKLANTPKGGKKPSGR